MTDVATTLMRWFPKQILATCVLSAATVFAPMCGRCDTAPPINSDDFKPYQVQTGTGHFFGSWTINGERMAGIWVLMIPATPYTKWLLDTHLDELRSVRKRVPKHADLIGLKGMFSAPNPDAVVPLTQPDPVVSASTWKVKSDSEGRFRFGHLPFGKYYMLIHWASIVDTAVAGTDTVAENGEVLAHSPGYIEHTNWMLTIKSKDVIDIHDSNWVPMSDVETVDVRCPLRSCWKTLDLGGWEVQE